MVELIRLEIEGFGKFAKKETINFKKKVNFITGLNETGKSTILEAILASLFKYTGAKIEPYFCWKNPDVCKLVLTYKTDKGETFRISSDYLSNRKVLEKITKGRTSEISTIISTIFEYVKEHFGFDEQKVFENTTFIRQSQMAILEDSTTKNKIKDMIEEVFAGTAEASATKSLKKLNKVSKDSRKEAELLEEGLYELKEELQKAEENKEMMNKDSSQHEKVSKELDEKSKAFEKLKETHKKFEQKEEYAKEFENLDKEVKKIDKTLLGVKETIKKKDKLIDKKEQYVGYDSLSDSELSEIKELIKNINDAGVSLKTYSKSSNKKKVVQETLDLKYFFLFVIGSILSVILIGIPLAIYAYKRMKKKEEKEVVDEERDEEIDKLNKIISSGQENLRDLTKKIKDFNKDTFLDEYNKYSKLIDNIEGYSASIIEIIKTELDKDEIGDNEEKNIRNLESKKIDRLNKLTIAQTNLKKYKLVNFSEDDLVNLQRLEGEVKQLGEQRVALKTSVSKTKELIKSPEDIQEEMNNIQQRAVELKDKAEEYDIAYSFLEKAETMVQHKFTPSLEKDSRSVLKEVTDNKYSELRINEETLDISIKAPEIKDYVEIGILSQGAKDQVYFSVRTTMSNLLSGNINLPLIFDDPFHNFDDIRLKRTIEAIKKIAESKQVILISHRPYHKEFKSFADNVIEVK